MMRTLETMKLPLLGSLRPFSWQVVSWDDIYLPGFIVGVLVSWLWVGLLLIIGMGVIICMTHAKWLGVALLLLVWLLAACLPRRLFGELRSVWVRRAGEPSIGELHFIATWYIAKCLLLIVCNQLGVELALKFALKIYLGPSSGVYLEQHNMLFDYIVPWYANLLTMICLVQTAAGNTRKLTLLSREVIIIYACFEYLARVVVFMIRKEALVAAFPMPYVAIAQYCLLRACLLVATPPSFQKKGRKRTTIPCRKSVSESMQQHPVESNKGT